MKIQVDDPLILDWYNYEIIDLDTGEPLKYVISADDDTGEYESYAVDSDGKVKFNYDKFEILKEKKRGNIKIQKKNL